MKDIEKLDICSISNIEKQKIVLLYESRKSVFIHTYNYERYLRIYSVKLNWVLFIINFNIDYYFFVCKKTVYHPIVFLGLIEILDKIIIY